jgi:glycosyltransferase involved in cell wall biosynthesis
MKAILITSANFPFGGAGANYLRLFSIGLVEKGWDVKVLLLKGYMYGKEGVKEKKSNMYGPIRYIHCGFINRPFNKFGKVVDNLLSAIMSCLYLVKEMRKGTYVLIYSNDTHLHALCFLIAKISRHKIISFVPEGLETTNRKSSISSYLSWFSFYLNMKFLNFYSSKLVVFSSFLKNYYTRMGYKSDNILLIPNLLDLDFFEAGQVSDDHKTRFRIGYCGNPSHKDGIEDLFDAFRIISKTVTDIELMVIGDSENQNSVITNFKDVLRKENLIDNVIFTGLIPYAQIPGKLKTCDVLVLARPSGTQADAGFPTKLGEYFACKKPVVITKVGDMPVFFKDGIDALLAEPDNPASVASKILWVKEHKTKSDQIAQNGYLWAKKNLDYKIGTENFIWFLKHDSQRN